MSLLRRLPVFLAALPIRFILVGIFGALVLSTTFLVGIISFYNARVAVNDVAEQLQAEVSARIEQHLQSFLGTAHRLNTLNAEMITTGLLPNDDLASLQLRYLGLVKSFDAPSSVYFGTTKGGLVGAGREVTGEYYVTETADLQAGTFVKTFVDEEGNRLEMASSVPGFDATSRPWYQRSVTLQQPTWSDVYILFTGDDVAVAASRPVYDEEGTLLGVVAVDISGARLTDYLQSLQIGKTGIAFVMDRSGLMVASSLPENLVIDPRGAGLSRIAAVRSPDQTIRSAALFLSEHFEDFQSISEQTLLRFSAAQENYFVQVTPHADAYGLNWLTVVVLPEADFMTQVDQSRNTTILLSAIAVLIAIALAIVLAQKVSEPLQQMVASTRQVREGQWAQLAHRSRVVEFQELIDAYNQMVAQLQETMERLSEEVNLRRKTESVLSENEERLSFIVEGAQLGTWDWQIETGEVAFNRRWATMLGYELSEISPTISVWQQLLHPDDAPAVATALESHLRGETDHYQMEQRLRTKDGNWKWVLDIGLVVERDEQGKPLRAAGIHQDISERKFAEEALIASHEELAATLSELQETQTRMMQQERLAAVGQLAAGIAHDFNNVLTAILMYGQLSLRDMSLDANLQRRLEIIVEQSRQGAALVQQILDFGRAAVMQRVTRDLTTVVEDGVQLARRTLSDQIEIGLALPSHPLPVEVDATRIQQALLNLFLNARDAMGGGGAIRVTLSLRDHRQEGLIQCAECGIVLGGRWACITVADTGTGIPPEHLSRIFEPFYTSKGTDGHGLGLAQVHGIVKQHGGHIAVESRANHGTTFHLYFPLQESSQLETPHLIPELPSRN